MNFTEDTKSLVNTIKEVYTKQMKMGFLTFIRKNGIIIDGKRNVKQQNQDSLVADISGIECLQSKIEYILLRKDDRIPENIISYLDHYEYTKQYKQFVMFTYDTNIEDSLEELIKNRSLIEFNCLTTDREICDRSLGIKKYFIQKNDIIYLKYTQILSDVEKNLIKFIVIVKINKKNKTVHICFDKILKKYHAHKDNFYLLTVETIKNSIEELFDITLQSIEFRSIVDYIKKHKKSELRVHGETMMNNGRKATLDSCKIDGKYQKPLFTGDFEEFFEDPDNQQLIETCDATRELARRFQSVFEYLEDTSDFPRRKIDFIEDGLDIKLVHDYKNSENTLFNLIGDFKLEEEWEMYVYEKFRKYFEEYNEYIQSYSFSD